MALEIDAAPLVGAESAEQREGVAALPRHLDQQVLKIARGMPARIGMIPDRLAQCRRPMHRHRIEEDVDVEQVLRALAPYPSVDRRAPVGHALAPLAALGHDAALAE